MTAAATTHLADNTLLEVERLTMRFGGLVAINDVSFSARSRQITGVIGPNGAGKTTLFNCITGFYKPTVGRLLLRGPGGQPFMLERMDGFRIGQKAKVARTFQNIRLFPGMSVLENLQMGGLSLTGGSTSPPAACPTATSGAWKSPVPCAPSRSCFASTNRPLASTRRNRPSSAPCCSRSATSSASACS